MRIGVRALNPGLMPVPNDFERLVSHLRHHQPLVALPPYRWLWDEAERFIAESLARQPADTAEACSHDADAFAAIHWCALAPRPSGQHSVVPSPKVARGLTPPLLRSPMRAGKARPRHGGRAVRGPSSHR
jgi:hypothetical protein